MPLQTSVTAAPARALPGLIYDSSAPHVAISGVVDRSAGIAPGLGCVRTAGGDFAAGLPALTFTAASFLGVSMHTHHALLAVSGANNEIYEDETVLPLMRRGHIWVICEDAFDAGDEAFVRFATGAGGSQLGAFRTSADTATAVAVAGLRFLTSGGAGELGVLAVNL